MIGCAVTSELDDLRSLSFGLLPSATERLKPPIPPFPPSRRGRIRARALFARFFLAVRSAFTIFVPV